MQDLLIDPLDLLDKKAVDKVSEKRKNLEKVIDLLLSKKPGPERWEQALKIYIGFNLSATDGMTAAEEVYYVTKENAETRAAQKNKYGTSGGGISQSDLRFQLNMPAGFRTFLKMVDPTVDSKENTLLLRKTFPSFVIAEAF